MNSVKSVSIIKEIRNGEKRVVLLPAQVPLFIQSGFKVFVESEAGEGINCSDQDYIASGAEIVSKREAWQASPFILKYKAPSKSETVL